MVWALEPLVVPSCLDFENLCHFKGSKLQQKYGSGMKRISSEGNDCPRNVKQNKASIQIIFKKH